MMATEGFELTLNDVNLGPAVSQSDRQVNEIACSGSACEAPAVF